MQMTARVLIVAVLLLSVPSVISAEEFCADTFTVTQGVQMQGRICTAPNKMRIENQGNVIIARMDLGKAWVLLPDERMYVEQPLDVSRIMGMQQKYPGEVSRTFEGKDKVDGKSAEKYRITYESQGKQYVMLVWFVPGIGMPVKTIAEDASWSTEYRNITTEKQPESLFEIPPGYKELKMPSMGEMAQGQ
ncbi:MAG: hypothetical protein AB1530_06655 [Candidatus Omnitrophota bacterium]